jgi:hypothetical protein
VFVWITDVLPDEVAGPIAQLMDRGVMVIKQTMEQSNVADQGAGGRCAQTKS